MKGRAIMCECGCVANHRRYRLPAPNDELYIITLAGCCRNCAAPAGVSIELVGPGSYQYEDAHDEDFGATPLVLEDWSDSKGVAIITGMTSGEFAKAIRPHLVGVSSEEIGEGGRIDADGSDVLADEMYEDMQFNPRLLAD